MLRKLLNLTKNMWNFIFALTIDIDSYIGKDN